MKSTHILDAWKVKRVEETNKNEFQKEVLHKFLIEIYGGYAEKSLWAFLSLA